MEQAQSHRHAHRAAKRRIAYRGDQHINQCTAFVKRDVGLRLDGKRPSLVIQRPHNIFMHEGEFHFPRFDVLARREDFETLRHTTHQQMMQH